MCRLGYVEPLLLVVVLRTGDVVDGLHLGPGVDSQTMTPPFLPSACEARLQSSLPYGEELLLPAVLPPEDVVDGLHLGLHVAPQPLSVAGRAPAIIGVALGSMESAGSAPPLTRTACRGRRCQPPSGR